MRAVIALGGNTLLRRGERADAAAQRAGVARSSQRSLPIDPRSFADDDRPVRA